MDVLIEKYAKQCSSWPYWRDKPDDTSPPAAWVSDWPYWITEEQKTFWRTFVSNMLSDLKTDVTLVESSKLDQIINLLNK